MKKKYYLLGIIFLIEILFYNIVDDIIIMAFFLLTAFLIGSLITKYKGTLSDLFKLAIGLSVIALVMGILVFLKWRLLSTLLLILLVLYICNMSSFKNILLDVKSNFRINSRMIVCIIIFMILIPVAIQPINYHDALVKHLPLPLKMISDVEFDFMTIESLTFSDFALVGHLMFSFLFLLGGMKAPSIFILLSGIFALYITSTMSMKFTNNSLISNFGIVILATTPFFLKLSTVLYLDVLVVFFLLIIVYQSIEMSDSALLCSLDKLLFLCGVTFAIKPTAVGLVFPIVVFLFFRIFKCYNISSNFRFVFKKFLLGIFWATLAFGPFMALLYIKTKNPVFPMANGIFQSPYFDMKNFKDPFKNYLGFTFNSLISIVFHTSKNVEMTNNTVGLHLLLFPLATLILLVKFISGKLKDKLFYFSYLFILISGYVLTTFLAYNIRYFIFIIVAMLPILIGIIYDTLARDKDNYKVFLGILIVCLISFNLANINKVISIKSFAYDNRITKNLNSAILQKINFPETKLLSLNDVYRGEFIGDFYGLNWYNTYFTNSISRLGIDSSQLILSFDYVLYNKVNPIPQVLGDNYFDLDELMIKGVLSIDKEDENYILYRVNEVPILEKIFEENYDVPIKVNVDEAKVISTINKFDYYLINLNINTDKEVICRWQINWHDKNGEYLGTTIKLYNAIDSNLYTSVKLRPEVKGAHRADIYINTHSSDEIKISSILIQGGYDRVDFLDMLNEEFDKTFLDDIQSILKLF